MPVTDVLVIGSGIAGLSAAIKIAQHFPQHKICILTKGAAAESNTQYAQGGISVVVDLKNDSCESHIQDTLRAGDGLCREEVVRMVVGEASERLQDLISIGVEFDRDQYGRLCLGREGGHHSNRIVHCKDSTGANISSVLLSKISTLPNISLLVNHAAIDLIVDDSSAGQEHRTCHGAYVLNEIEGNVQEFKSRVTILATGGIGQLYSITTNPRVATGDGIAMAWRAGAKVSDMEFIQFHPTALFSNDSNPCFLISEAVRGHGAFLVNEAGERFLFQYHPDGELACRDVVSRAIIMEMARHPAKSVYLDCTHIADDLQSKFPTIYEKCLSVGLDLKYHHIPVQPAAHYLCGGIDVDTSSRTTVNNLYACGECSNTGLHGANRLASNSLLEALVFAHSCYVDIAGCLDRIPVVKTFPGTTKKFNSTHANSLQVFDKLKYKVKQLMSTYCGIVRSNAGLQVILKALLEIRTAVREYEEFNTADYGYYEVKNMVEVALLVVNQSIRRKDNRGGFFSIDLDHEEHLHSLVERK